MARSIWNGTITFGLIAVPIKVHSATESHTIHFHQAHEKDGARIKQKRICSKEDMEVPYEEVAMGYEMRGGEFVTLSKEEIDAAAGERSRTIELETFVEREQIDPVFYDRPYYLAAGGWKDRYRRRLQDVVSRKRKGQTIKAPEPREPTPEQAPDLMDALERTLAEMRGSGTRAKQEA